MAAPLDPRERRKRKRELWAIVFSLLFFIGLTFVEFRLTRLSKELPFVNSIFFFGLLNINIILLLIIVWLVFRNLGKLFIERRRNVLGARLKTKLVASFLSFSIVPTLVLFVISALYINSSFDKWFNIRVQNTLKTSLEITSIYSRNTETTTAHFAHHLASALSVRTKLRDLGDFLPEDIFQFAGVKHGIVLPLVPDWMNQYLHSQRQLLGMDSVEYYPSPYDPAITDQKEGSRFPRIPLETLNKAFSGNGTCIHQDIGEGRLVRCLEPVKIESRGKEAVIAGLTVSSYVPLGLVHKVDEVESVLDDLKDTNPLKYPIKTTYLVILVMVTLVIIFVAIWIGLYMAKELTVPVERLVQGARAVGAGDLDVQIAATGRDEIAVLIESFNGMIRDLKENRVQLTQTGKALERRRAQLEAILANVGAGVISVDPEGRLITINRAAESLLRLKSDRDLGRNFIEVLGAEFPILVSLIEKARDQAQKSAPSATQSEQWTDTFSEQKPVLGAIATSIQESRFLEDAVAVKGTGHSVVAVIDDLTPIVKGQREMAWREVARRIAHEIKNPLTPIKLSAQRLQRKLSSPRDREEQAFIRDCTETIIRHTDELKEMVNEFSNFARLPEVTLAPHSLNDALTEVVGLFQQARPDINWFIDWETRLPIFDFDRDQIKRVCINLVDNALSAIDSRLKKSSDKNLAYKGRIRIASHYNPDLQIAAFEIHDNGEGMSEDIKERVFEPYFSLKEGGTGLGLAIAKRIINDHDGFIRVQSILGEGTRFLVELPIAKK